MAIFLYNTLKRRKELFKPIKKGEISLYTCGPTVYDYSHIGNFRTFLFEDLLKKWLAFSGYKVKHVMNITDVDDKTIRKSIEKKISLKQLTKFYEQKFFENLDWLRMSNADLYPRATESIDKIINIILVLIKKDFAYVENDGSVYFKINSFKDYGKLSNFIVEESHMKKKVLRDEYEKETPQDFALWKGYKKTDGAVFWSSPWGKGRPGWHIECSAMSLQALGESFDIHCGGVDNIFPHHENEIAQSECYTGKKFVNYWLHSEHLLFEKAKMSKSKENYYTIDYLKKLGFKSGALRYLMLSGHYRTKINFSLKSKVEGNKVVAKIKNFYERLKEEQPSKLPLKYLVYPREFELFKKHMNDDLNTPMALAVFFKYIKKINKKIEENKLTKVELGNSWKFLCNINKIFNLININFLNIPKNVKQLIKMRKKERECKNWEASDKLRKEILKHGFIVNDSKNGQKISKVSD